MEEKRLIKFEMRRAFGKTFFIAYLIGFLSGCGGLISYWIQVRWTPVESISCFDAWLYCYSVAESSAYKVIFPLVICLPYLTTIYTDRKSGMIFNIVSRMSYSQYLISKLAVGIVETIIMSASVLMSWFVISISLFPLNIPDTELNVFVTGAFSEFYTEAPLKYILILLLLNVVFSITFFVSCVSISIFLNSKYQVVVVPFAIYFVLEFCAQYTNYAYIHPIAYYLPFEFLPLTITQIITGIGVIIAINIVVICAQCRKRDIL